MKPYKGSKSLDRIKTGKLERRVSMMGLGIKTGARVAAQAASNLFVDSSQRGVKHRMMLEQEAERFVAELGALKGSVVKIGQMMALWGEHYLPPEVTQALHRLEDDTTSMSWSAIHAQLQANLPSHCLAELEIEEKPIAAASLGQVHRARRKSDGVELCIKIQYPGVASAIDSDLDAVSLLLRVARLVPMTQDFKIWFEEIRSLLKQEVNYVFEAQTMQRFAHYLEGDSRYIVPKVYPEYSNSVVLTMSYEPGSRIVSDEVVELESERKNKISEACLDLFWREVFHWGEMQTDPNFGNYLVRLNAESGDQIVLLDFGAVRRFSPDMLDAGKQLIQGSLQREERFIKEALDRLDFFRQSGSDDLVSDFAGLCYVSIEPFMDPNKLAELGETETMGTDSLWNEAGEYDWAASNLANRVIARATRSACSKYFNLPPKDFMFLSRKFIGAYTLMAVLKAQVKGYSIVSKYLN